MTMVYIVGTITLTFASLNFNFISMRIISFVGIVAIMIGTGGVKSCQNAIGGDLFKLPEQASKLDDFFTLHLIALKLGQVSGMTILPILRFEVKCFGFDDCYSIAYGVAAIFSTLAFFAFYIGKKHFVHNNPSENITVQVVRCVMVRHLLINF